MSITKAAILTHLNAALRRSETDIDPYIILTLEDLSDLHLLKANSTALTVTSSSVYLDYPTDALDDQHAIISVTLTDSSSERQWPLDPVIGGWREYCREMTGFTSSSRSIPTHYVCNDRKIYLLPAPDSTYTVDLWYFKRHANSADTIEFTDSWSRAIKFGTLFEFCVAHKLVDYISIYSQRYQEARDFQKMVHDDGTYIVGDHV
jgi:hypothetical protein